MVKLNVEARAMAKGLQEQGFGFDPTPILTIALALFSQCSAKENPNESPADVARNSYDEQTDSFDPHAIGRARLGMRKAVNISIRRGETPKRHFSIPELDAMTIKVFRSTMEADEDIVRSCMAEGLASNVDAM